MTGRPGSGEGRLVALPWALRGLRNGVLTTRYPRRSDAYFDDFRNGVEVIDLGRDITPEELEETCPTGALSLEPAITVDRGACIACGRCVQRHPDIFAWRDGSDVATTSRQTLVLNAGNEDDAALQELRNQLAVRTRALRRSVHLRHIDVGSDGSDEWEIQALLNPVYDVHRLGIFFTASPRHADILLVTGIGAPGMRAPLQRTLEAMPNPLVVIAVGTDAVSGGLFDSGYGSSGGIGDLIDVDVWIPGSPASPFSILHGILLALDRVQTPPVAAHNEGEERHT